jgi:hypothetical protein
MSECSVMRERMPQLLVEALDLTSRESTHQHIESCRVCETEWIEMRETWDVLGALPEVAVPARVRTNFLAQAESLFGAQKVVAFRPRRDRKWIAQAAAVAVIATGGWFAGRTTVPASSAQPVEIAALQSASFPISEKLVIPSSQMIRGIEGSPDIQNVRFTQGADGKVSMTFDLTSEVTVQGQPDDRNLASLVSYVLANGDQTTQSRSRAIEWVRANSSQVNEPEVARALAGVLQNESHEGVKLKAVEALKLISSAGGEPETRAALIEALKNDPNPAVRIKAVQALAEMARTSTPDSKTLDTLREKAQQADENPYVRVKAAEALSQIHL